MEDARSGAALSRWDTPSASGWIHRSEGKPFPALNPLHGLGILSGDIVAPMVDQEQHMHANQDKQAYDSDESTNQRGTGASLAAAGSGTRHCFWKTKICDLCQLQLYGTS